jgi:hypothetical protein
MPHVYTIDGPLGLARNQAPLAFSGRPGVVFNDGGQPDQISGLWFFLPLVSGVAASFLSSWATQDDEDGSTAFAGGVVASIAATIGAGIALAKCMRRSA